MDRLAGVDLGQKAKSPPRLVDDLGLRRLSGALETDSEMVADFERAFGKRLPDDYVAFLCKIGT